MGEQPNTEQLFSDQPTPNPELNIHEKLVIQKTELSMKMESMILKTKPYTLYRWLFFAFLFITFLARMIIFKKYYAIAYIAGLYLVNSFILFLSPKLDPDEYGETLPSRLTNNEYKPFIRKLPEFSFWQKITIALIIAHIAACIPFLDIPVYGPILFFYFILVFLVSFHGRIMHMIRHHYLPFTSGKPTYKKADE